MNSCDWNDGYCLGRQPGESRCPCEKCDRLASDARVKERAIEGTVVVTGILGIIGNCGLGRAVGLPIESTASPTSDSEGEKS